jgi:ABC-type dipeptide/oligopeptide/nickel transport system permease subunit
MNRRMSLVCAGSSLGLLLLAAALAPEHLGDIQPELALMSPLEVMPFGTDTRGRSLVDYATQGARVLALPALSAGVMVALFGVLGGLLRCTGSVRVNAWIQWFAEIVGALPRMVVILVVALLLPREHRSLFPLAWTWALLAAPGAMDEAAAVAERLGGSRFVEALRAHGYSARRIFLVHVVGFNLRPVVVRQGAETMMHVAFLEIALSYLALAENQPSFTHADSLKSWADLLKLGYPSLIPSLGYNSGHALALGLVLLGLVAMSAIAIGRAARAR